MPVQSLSIPGHWPVTATPSLIARQDESKSGVSLGPSVGCSLRGKQQQGAKSSPAGHTGIAATGSRCPSAIGQQSPPTVRPPPERSRKGSRSSGKRRPPRSHPPGGPSGAGCNQAFWWHRRWSSVGATPREVCDFSLNRAVAVIALPRLPPCRVFRDARGRDRHVADEQLHCGVGHERGHTPYRDCSSRHDLASKRAFSRSLHGGLQQVGSATSGNTATIASDPSSQLLTGPPSGDNCLSKS